MAMTEAERKAARNEASKRWYALHKAKNAKAAAAPAPKRGRPAKTDAKPVAKAEKPVAKAEKPVAKKSDDRPAKTEQPKKAIFSSGKDPNAALQKQIDKMIKRNVKAVEQVKSLVKEAAPLLSDLAKHEDQKFASKAAKSLLRQLSLDVTDVENGKREVAFSSGAKAFRVPKVAETPTETKTTDEPSPETAEVPHEEPVDVPETLVEGDKPAEIPVDPSKLDNLPIGSTAPAEVADDDDGHEDDQDEDEDEPSWKGKDPDEMTDEERAEYEEALAEEAEEADLDGRAETMREMEAQGAFED